jgi:tetratricopeptide (TPR) repeat protein
MTFTDISEIGLQLSINYFINNKDYNKAIILLKEYLHKNKDDFSKSYYVLLKLVFCYYNNNNYFDSYCIIEEIINNYKYITNEDKNKILILKSYIMIYIREYLEAYHIFKYIYVNNVNTEIKNNILENLDLIKDRLLMIIKNNKIKSDIIISNIKNTFDIIISNNIIENYTCQLTQNIYIDPVLAEDGYIYEKSAIELWIIGGNETSPISNEIFSTYKLKPVNEIKEYLHTYLY